MEKFLSKFFIIVWLFFIYFAFSFFVSGISENKNSDFSLVESIFAWISFDNQNPNKWYNSSNPNASVYTSPNPVPPPVNITTISRYSH